MMKKVLFFAMLFALSLTAKEYEINYTALQNRIFFAKTAAEKSELWEKTQFITSFPKGEKVCVSPRGINEFYVYNAIAQKAEIIAGTLRYTSIRQVNYARNAGFKVCLMTADNVNDVVMGLLESPDYILCSPSLDLDRIKTLLMTDQSSKVKKFTPVLDWNDLGDRRLNYQSVAKRSEGTDLRVLSYNILAQSFDEARLASVRADGIAEVINHIAPDVAGIQEVDLHWYANLDNGCLAPMAFVEQEVYPYPPSIALLYNTKKFKLLEKGFVPFTDKWIRAMSWALLENLSDGKRFIVTNTHWALNVPKRMGNATIMAESINQLKNKYNCPVISFGDFNCRVGSDEFSLLLASADMKDAIETAPFVENREMASGCMYKYFSAPLSGDKHIDHVVYCGDLTLLSARLVLDKKLLELSDHLPLVVDFKY